MIKSLRLVNWRSHSDTSLQFSNGTNLLIGIMGAGKSSILEAISFALFGTFPALEHRKLKLDNVVRLSEPSAKIVMEFVWDNSTYRVERTIDRSKKGTSTTAEVFKDNVLKENGTVAVNSYIQHLTSVDYDLFTRAIYSEQNNIDHFLNLDPRKRKEELDVLLGLDKFETARANIVSVMNQFKTKRQANEAIFSRVKLSELEQREKNHSDSVTLLGTTSKVLAEQYLKQQATSSDLSKKFDEVRLQRNQFEQLDRDSIRCSATLEGLKKELDGKTIDKLEVDRLQQSLTILEAERGKCTSALRESDAKLSAAMKESGMVDAKIKAAADAAANLTKLVQERVALLGTKTQDSFASIQKSIEGELLAFSAEKKSLELELPELEASLTKLLPGMSSCPLCSSKLDGDAISHVKAEREARMSTNRARISVLTMAISSKQKENEILLLQIRKLALLSDRIASLEKDVVVVGAGLVEKKAAIGAEIERLSHDRKTVQAASDSLVGQAEKLKLSINEQKTLLAKKAEFELAEKKLAETTVALQAIKFDPKSFDELRIAAEESKLVAERARSDLAAMENQLKHSQEMLKLLRDELASMRLLEANIQSSADLEVELAIYRGALLETQLSLRTGLVEAVNSAMNEIWSLVYPYRNYSALRLGVSEKDYAFEVNDNGSWKALETVASGGERACAALALRVALAMVLTPKLSWLILDEPTHNLDREAVEMLSSALQFNVPEVVKQTFVITHDDGFIGSDFASSYRLTRDKARNGETKAEVV